MLFKFLPHETDFFDLLDKQASYAVDAAKFFKETVQNGVLEDSHIQKMKDVEHQGDDACHEIIHHLNKTFITPFDREDIHNLTCEVDDIIDMLHTITNRLKVYRLDGVDKHLVRFAFVIDQSVNCVAQAIQGLRNKKNFKAIAESCVEVNRLENVGDAMRDEVLAELLNNSTNPIMAIKWKEIYEDAETVLDICEDVAHIVENILVKQA